MVTFLSSIYPLNWIFIYFFYCNTRFSIFIFTYSDISFNMFLKKRFITAIWIIKIKVIK